MWRKYHKTLYWVPFLMGINLQGLEKPEGNVLLDLPSNPVPEEKMPSKFPEKLFPEKPGSVLDKLPLKKEPAPDLLNSPGFSLTVT
ncbi:MAG: hypothetical protein LBJ81_02420, partial [Puniceicoccales bacterium]|nr:hypothetical protein [Puniceicoccales bacterium]